MILAGTLPTIAYGGTSFVTTAPAASHNYRSKRHFLYEQVLNIAIFEVQRQINFYQEYIEKYELTTN